MVVDLAAITANVAAFVEFVDGVIVCPAIKADGYGHGDVPVAEAVLAGGAGRVAVATVDEGIRLREAGISVPVMVFSESSVSAVAALIQWQLTPTIYQSDFLDALVAAQPEFLAVHVKVDTGMHRAGAPSEVALKLAERIEASENLVLEGVMSHLAVADTEPQYTQLQRDRFVAFIEELSVQGIDPPIKHLANTAGIFAGPDYWFDMVRPGIGVYGLPPNPDIAPPIALRAALRVESAVSHVQRLAKGERPSYGRRRALDRESTVVTVPIGYADGYARGLSDAEVLIGGIRYPIAGTVTMDQIVVDVGDADVSMGDEVVLIGTQGSDEITATELARRLDTINYEIVTRLGPRLRRVYRS